MKNEELVSRISSQLKTVSKDDYISRRFILHTAVSIARKFITQKIQKRSIDRDTSLYREIKCIEFEPIDVFKCKYVEFKSCHKLSRSLKKFSDLIYTRYGSSIKELYSIDGKNSFTESTLYQLRVNSERAGSENENSKFYLLDDYIYLPEHIKALSGLVLMTDQYELDELCGCEENCESVWDKDFIAPDSQLEDVISYTIQNLLQTKQIQEDESPNLNGSLK